MPFGRSDWAEMQPLWRARREASGLPSNTSGRHFLPAHQGSTVTLSSLLFHPMWQGLGYMFSTFFYIVYRALRRENAQ